MIAPAVLLVDDEPGVLYTLREVLTERGHRVLTAPSGATALPQLDDAAVVVTDLQMPGMSGYEATEALRRQHSAATLPVIALTAGALVSERERALVHGMTDFLTKPIDPPRLQAALLRALAGRAPAAGAGGGNVSPA